MFTGPAHTTQDPPVNFPPPAPLKDWMAVVGLETALSALAELMDGAAVFAIDGQGAVRFWSAAAERLLGVPAAEALGRPAESVVLCRACGGPSLLIERGRLDHEPAEVQKADGSFLRVRRSARAFYDANGAFTGAIGALWPEAAEAAEAQGAPRREPVETFHGLVTRDPAMKQTLRIIRNVAETDATVLIRGESGTGKELVARALHEEGRRRGRPFLAINCAALSPSLLESELFGHARGAFTGALKEHAGLFKRADRGTLFLDEVAELPLELQAKLLRVLQERTFLPVGADKPVTVDVRIVAATHRSLREEVKAGRFREDLMYRLRVVPVFLPALRERREDIPLLLRHFIDRHNAKNQRRILNIEPEALRTLWDYGWPGNIRELQNVVEYAFAVGRGEALRPEDLPPEFSEPGQDAARPGARSHAQPVPFAQGLEEPERIRAALAQSAGRIDTAAELLGMSRATFWRKRKKLGI
jgi:transcriptional regulator with PAS, ATPase and Fis domain